MVGGPFPRHKQVSYLAVCSPEISLLHSTDSGRNFGIVSRESVKTDILLGSINRAICSFLIGTDMERLLSHDSRGLPQKFVERSLVALSSKSAPTRAG